MLELKLGVACWLNSGCSPEDDFDNVLPLILSEAKLRSKGKEQIS